jgi:hypothetical protein
MPARAPNGFAHETIYRRRCVRRELGFAGTAVVCRLVRAARVDEIAPIACLRVIRRADCRLSVIARRDVQPLIKDHKSVA